MCRCVNKRVKVIMSFMLDIEIIILKFIDFMKFLILLIFLEFNCDEFKVEKVFKFLMNVNFLLKEVYIDFYKKNFNIFGQKIKYNIL